MQINRGLVFWGVGFITAGAVALAIQSGAIDGERALELWRYWPVVLVLIGLAIVTARTPFALVVTLAAGLFVGALGGSFVGGWPSALSFGCGGNADQLAASDGTFSGSAAQVELDFSCGELALAMASGNRWDVDARYAGDARPTVTSDGGGLRVRSNGGGFPFGDGRQEWQVTLPRDVRLGLDVDVNAASSMLDLTGGRFDTIEIDANAGSATVLLGGADARGLEIDANAGSVSVTADASTTLAGAVGMNAGSMSLCVPSGVVFAITVTDTNVTFSHNLDDRGLTRSGDTWSSGPGTPAITLNVSGNAASFALNPEGGC